MAENNLNNSWNPLSYSQNLCVVSSSGSVGSLATNDINNGLVDSHRDESLVVDPLSPLDLQNTANNELNQLVNDLITINNNNNDFRLNSSQSLNSLQINSFISDNSLTKAFNCGDFGLNSGNKQEVNGVPVNTANGYNPLSVSQSAYSQNTLPFIQTQDLMDSQRYSNIESFPDRIRTSNTLTQSLNGLMSDQLNPMSNQLMNSLNNSMSRVLPNPTTNPLPNQITTSLASSLSHQNSSQSLVQSLPYNQNQTLHRNNPLLELSASESSQMGSRQLRSIRARNSNQSSVEPTNRLNYYFDRSYEQFKHLEKERKKIECELIQAFVGQKISSANNIPIQRLTQNASKVDRIITDMSREHAKVITIVAKMEQLKGQEFNELIHNSIQKWYEIIRNLQMKRKIEVQRNSANVSAIGSPEDAFIVEFCQIMRQLLSAIRCVRTCLWSALVITLYDQTMA